MLEIVLALAFAALLTIVVGPAICFTLLLNRIWNARLVSTPHKSRASATLSKTHGRFVGTMR